MEMIVNLSQINHKVQFMGSKSAPKDPCSNLLIDNWHSVNGKIRIANFCQILIILVL